MIIKRKESGDTIVEVLLSAVIISVVIMGAYTLTNSATRQNQAAIEQTIVANLMRQQTELIRGARQSNYNGGVWQEIITNWKSAYPNYSVCNPNGTAFYVDPAITDFDVASNVKNNSGGGSYPDSIFRIWVQAYNPAGEDYFDFHVRACWTAQGGQEQREASILRLEL